MRTANWPSDPLDSRNERDCTPSAKCILKGLCTCCKVHITPSQSKSPPCLKLYTPLWPFSKSKFNLKSDRVNLVAPASPIECLLHLPNVRAIQYKLWLERLTRLRNSNTAAHVYVSQSLQFCLPIRPEFWSSITKIWNLNSWLQTCIYFKPTKYSFSIDK